MLNLSMSHRLLIGILLIVPLGILGQVCLPYNPAPTPAPTNTPPTITGVGVNGTLVQGQPGGVEIQATVSDDGTVESVTANLIRIGGSQAQPMVLGQNELWTFTGTVTPPNSGQQRVTVLATDDKGLSSQSTASVNVAATQPTQTGPQITSPSVTGTLVAGEPGTVTVTANVTAASGTTLSSVLADLSQIGGFADTPLIATTTSRFSFSGLVTPLNNGTQNVTIEATDNLGTTASVTVPITVASGL